MTDLCICNEDWKFIYFSIFSYFYKFCAPRIFLIIFSDTCKKGKAIPLQAWGDPEAPRFQDNRHMKVVRLSALSTGRLYPT